MQVRRNRIAYAFVGSVLVHVILLLLFATVVAFRKDDVPPTPPPDEPLQVEVAEETPTPPPPLVADATPTPTPQKQRVIDANGPDSTDTPPPDAAISDRTTKASSSAPATGDQKGPSQSGKQMTVYSFDPAPPAPGIVDHSTPSPVETAPEPAKPAATPKAERFAVSTPPPINTPQPTATPPPPERDEFAMIMATPTPPPEDPFDPFVRSTSPPLPKPALRPTPKPTPTPQVGSARTQMSGGGVSVSDTAGLDTIATPVGRYTQKIATMIKFIWSRSNDAREGGSGFGSVVVHFTIDRNGLVISPRVISNTADSISAAIAYQAVVVVRLPAMPPDVVAELQEMSMDGLPVDITFALTP